MLSRFEVKTAKTHPVLANCTQISISDRDNGKYSVSSGGYSGYP
jgi:hypothetical protein